ncbi:patatin-like phospholipase family protein [Geodermatophilus sp. SYSU D00691]
MPAHGAVPRRPRVAVALGGGGARGFAHIGVLQVLEDRGYDVVSVAGSSMGALVGGVYAAGTLDGFAAWVRSLTHRDVLRLYDLAPGAPGAIRAGRLFAKLGDFTGDARIEDLPVAFTAVATDLRTGEERWFRDGPLDAALRASVALPGFMTPVVVDGRVLADGGLVNPLPIAPTLAARADLTVAVAVTGAHRVPAEVPHAAPRRRNGSRRDVVRPWRTSPPDRAASEATGPVADALPPGLRTLDVIELSLNALRTTVLRHTLAAHPPDVLVSVPRSACRTLDFHKAGELIRLGSHLAAEALDRLEGRSVTYAAGEGS